MAIGTKRAFDTVKRTERSPLGVGVGEHSIQLERLISSSPAQLRGNWFKEKFIQEDLNANQLPDFCKQCFSQIKLQIFALVCFNLQ